MYYLFMFIKIHNIGDRKLLAIADENLVGQTFEEGDVCLFVDELFYSGEIKEEEEVIAILKSFQDFNAVGQESVQLLVREGIIDAEDVLYVGGVAHACVTAA